MYRSKPTVDGIRVECLISAKLQKLPTFLSNDKLFHLF